MEKRKYWKIGLFKKEGISYNCQIRGTKVGGKFVHGFALIFITPDDNHLGKTNFVVIKSKIDKKCNELVKRSSGQRHELSQLEIDTIVENLENILTIVEVELLNG